MVPSSVNKYLDTLPSGAASYPECVVKASVLRNALVSRQLGREVELPPTIRKLVDDPPTVGEWISEVHFNAAMLAIREVHFNPRTLDDYRAWVYEQNHKLLGTPLYRVLFLLVSPDRLLSGIEKRWGAFRRGSEIQVVDRAKNVVQLRLRYPAFLYPSLTVQAMMVAFQAAMDHAGARQARVVIASSTSTETVLAVTWQ
jgi:hypothetical protein